MAQMGAVYGDGAVRPGADEGEYDTPGGGGGREGQGREEENHADIAHRNGVGQITVYIDGGCTNPAHRVLRRATYGVFDGDGHKWNRSEPLKGM